MAKEDCCSAGLLDGLASILWPIFVAGVVWYFRAEIKAGIGRITHIGMDGLSLDPGAKQTAQTDLTSPGEPLSPAVPSAPVYLAETLTTVKIIEDSIVSDARARNLSGENFQAILVRELAATRLCLAFERIYGQIFGSQIALLQQLNAGPVSRAAARSIFDRAVASHPTFFRNFSFDVWLNFLVVSGLIDGQDEPLTATPAVSEFLSYIATRRLTTEKFG